MKQTALIVILIAGLCLAVIVIGQTTTPQPEVNNSSVPTTGGDVPVPSENLTPAIPSSDQYVQGELLVRFNPEAFPNMNALNALSMQAHAAIGAVKIDEFRGIPGLEQVRLPPAMSVQDGIAYYKAIPTVMYAEPNAIYSIANASGQGNATVHPPPAGNTTSTGDVFVQYNMTAFASPADLQVYANATNTPINASVITDYTGYGMPGLQLVGLDANMTTEKGIAYYKNVTHVEYAEPNVQYNAVAVNQTGTT